MKNRKIRFSPAMDAEERYQQKRLGYIKFCLSEIHKIPLEKITLNRETKDVPIQGEVVIKTGANGSLQYTKYQDIEPTVEEHTGRLLTKKNSSHRL